MQAMTPTLVLPWGLARICADPMATEVIRSPPEACGKKYGLLP